MAHQVGYDPAWRYRDVLERQAHGATQSLITGELVAAIPFSPAEIDRMVGRYAAKVGHAGVRLRKVDPTPIRPPIGDEKLYNRTLQRRVLRPFMRSVRSGLSQATAAAEALERLDRIPVRTTRRTGLIKAEVDAQAARLQGYHRRRLISTFRRSLAVDIRPVLSEAPIRRLMNGWRRENIDLIQTVPERLKAGLRTKMTRAFREAPFDQARLQRIVAQQGKVGGYDLRRITRDQTSKAIGQLTRARHQQIGIDEYTWQTSRDGRVRDSHAILEGTRQTYDNPPSVGNPGQDIQCRCVAAPVIPDDLVDPQAVPATAKPAPAAPQVDPMLRQLEPLRREQAVVQQLKAEQARLAGQPQWARPEGAQAAVRAKLDELENFRASVGRELGMSPQALEQALAQTFADDSVGLYMAIKPSNLHKVLKTGRFKNSLETGKGTYKTIADARLIREREFFGLTESLEVAEMAPKYAFAAGKRQMDWGQIMKFDYGDTYVKFRPAVRQRTTITLGDSFNKNSALGVTPATPINAPKIDLLRAKAGRGVSDKSVGKALESRSYKKLATAIDAEYVEAQIYGRLPTSAIESVEFASKKQMARFARAAKKAKLDITVKPSSQHERLYRMANGYDDSWSSLAARDIDRLGQQYIDKVWNRQRTYLYGRPARGGLKELTPPRHIREWAAKNQGDVTLAQKREGLKLYYAEIAKKEAGGYPKFLWNKFRPTQAGFTDDVANEALLKAYPGG